MQDAPGEKVPAAAFDRELRGKTRRSVGWSVARTLSDQFFSFIVFVLLAQLLAREDIGIFAMAYVFAEVGRIIATGGLTQIIARAERVDAKLVDTVFWTNVAVALLYASLLAAAAPFIADLLRQPSAQLPLQILPIATVINALGATHMALRLREFGHRAIALRSLLAGLIGGAAAVAAALNGFGVWSLVVQRIVMELVGMLLSWTAYRWVPGRRFDFAQMRANLEFGGNITVAQLIFLFLVRLQDLLIGASLGAAAVGVYRVAWRTAEIIGNGAIQPFASVGLQTYSRLQSNLPALREAYRSMLRSAAILSFPALVGFGVLAPHAVPLIYGPKWHEAGSLAQVFAFMGIPYTLNYFASPVLGAMGESARQRTLAFVQLVFTAALTLLALPYGLFWVAVAYVFRAYLTMPLQIRFLRQASSIRFADTWQAVRAPFAASCAMGLALWGALAVWERLEPVGWAALGLFIACGAAFYSIVLLAISPPIRAQIRNWKREFASNHA
ncbi:lipopolysaccharide biosynthesis protein [Sphingosinicella sp. CPCC 101087]|uniref:lipopolysaccharide biosynthesis protein n=1 Tax=Sphingosinicella sp. CPCC 101087 TaxID=2497754 RepID=UPI00101DA54E|nr:lipopolysaccharide biosynthesis protein [Sphingosinicella sp. CPCC 101087]